MFLHCHAMLSDLPKDVIGRCMPQIRESSRKLDCVSEEMWVDVTEWIARIHQSFNLHPETLNLAIRTFDTFLRHKTRSTFCANLAGVTALLIASKYEDTPCATCQDMVVVAGGTYNEAMVRVPPHYMHNYTADNLGAYSK
jgi:hypothetical protein